MPTATFVKQRNGTGEGRVYRLDPPMPLSDEEADQGSTSYVWVSATVVPYDGGPETYIFACDAEGQVSDWGELPGSYKGGLDHDEALRGAGYEVAYPVEATP